MGVLKVLGKYPIVWGMTGSLAASSLAAQSLNSTWVLFTTARFGWGARDNGLSLAAFGLVALIFQVGLARIILPKIGERKAVVLGLAVGTLEYAGYAFATHGWMIYAILLLGGVSFLSGQATQGLLSRQVGEDEQGTLQGALTSLNSLAGIVGPLIATGLFAWFTRPRSPVYAPGAPFFLSALLDVLALGLAVHALRRFRPPAVVAEAVQSS